MKGQRKQKGTPAARLVHCQAMPSSELRSGCLKEKERVAGCDEPFAVYAYCISVPRMCRKWHRLLLLILFIYVIPLIYDALLCLSDGSHGTDGADAWLKTQLKSRANYMKSLTTLA